MTYVTDSGTETQGITHEEMKDMWETLSPNQRTNKKFSNLCDFFGGTDKSQGKHKNKPPNPRSPPQEANYRNRV